MPRRTTRHQTIQGTKQEGFPVRARIVLSDNDWRTLARHMVDIMCEEPMSRTRKPKISLEKPPTKRKPRKKSKKGPTVHRSKDLDFSKEEVRRRETRKLIRKLAKEKGTSTREMAIQIRFEDFRKNGIGLVMRHHDNSPFMAVVEAYPGWNLMPWDMRYGVRHFWKSKENRVAALNFALKKSRKRPEEIREPHFKEAGLHKLLNRHKIYSLLVDAEYAYSLREIREHARTGQFRDDKLYPWQLTSAPFGFYKKPINRKCATRWLVWAMDGEVHDIGVKDIEDNIRGILPYYYEKGKGGYKGALRDAGFEPKVTPKRPTRKSSGRKKSKKGPTTYHSKDLDFSKEEVRRRETRKLIRKLAKEKGVTIRQMAIHMGFNDFRKNGLGMVIGYHRNSPYNAVVEAYPKWNLMPWEMKFTPHHFFRVKKNRIAAFNWLIKKCRKKPSSITASDFYDNGLGTLLIHYKASPTNALIESGYVYSMKEAIKQGSLFAFKEDKLYIWQAGCPHNFYAIKRNRVTATRWLVWSLGIEPKDILNHHFYDSGFCSLLRRYPKQKGGFKAALREAGFDV